MLGVNYGAVNMGTSFSQLPICIEAHQMMDKIVNDCVADVKNMPDDNLPTISGGERFLLFLYKI